MTEIKCQAKGCRAHVCWIVASPNLFEGKKADENGALQKPIGFCSTPHLIRFFECEYGLWLMNNKREYKRFEKRRERR